MRLPTVIYTHGGGRLGNQIIRFAHWIAWVRANQERVRIIDMGFWRYSANFHHWRDRPGCAFPGRSTTADCAATMQGFLPGWILNRADWRLQRLVHFAGRLWPGGGSVALDDARGEVIELSNSDFLSEVARRRVTTCSGWRIACWPMVAEQNAELREFFRPAPDYAARAIEFINILRARNDMVVGVLIRQSDYKVWNKGRFYFSTAQYATWIRQLLDLHPGKQVAIIVASEEWQNPAEFAGLPVTFATGNPKAGGDWFENWVELSLCDFVLTAPSTFSATAAFVGAVPLWPVTSADQELAVGQLLQNPLIDAARHPEFSQCVR